jgi:hypothetical protein
MSNSISYKWQSFIDGIDEVKHTDDTLLLEMRQSIIDRLSTEIKTAESGDDSDAPFNDIFGTSTPDNVKNRMIIPYGNEDIYKMKILMLDIIDKLFEEYNKNPNIESVKPIWDNQKQIVKQQRKPQGWVEGDPIPTIEKEVGSPIVDVIYTSKLGDKKERTIQLSFGKLLQKYFPDQMTWWQGDKSKGVSGKQSFFTSNVETMDQIIHEVKFGDEDIIRNEKPKSSVVIFSRHPIDVVRMSDFDLLSYSCHAQGGAYFRCAVEEARRSAMGGGVLFMVSKDKFDKAFPDGVMPQTGDLFSDAERGISGKLNAQATSRLRVRRVVDGDTGVEYAVPDKKIYGNMVEAFRKETFQYFANSQKQKFIDPETNQPILSDPTMLMRYGGEYEDVGEYKIGANFVTLVDTALRQANVFEEVRDTEQYKEFAKHLTYTSITWSGEQEEGVDEEEDDFCAEYEEAAYNKLARANRNVNYVKFGFHNIECQGQDDAYIEGFNASVQVKIPISRFKPSALENNMIQIKNAVKMYDYDEMLTIDVSFKWPNLSLEEILVESVGDEVYIEFFYQSKDYITDTDEILAHGRDFAQFENQLSYDQYVAEVEAILEQAGVLNVSLAASMKEQIDDLIQYVADEDSLFSYSKSGGNHKFSIYSRPIVVKEMSEFKQFEAEERSFNSPSLMNSYANEFARIFFNRANEIDDEIKKQVTLFQDIPSQQLNRLKIPGKAVEIHSRASIKDADFTSRINNTYRRKFSYAYDFIVTINSSMTQEEALLTIAFIKYITENIGVLDDIAVEAFYKTFSYSLKESKKAASSKLVKEGKWKIKISR